MNLARLCSAGFMESGEGYGGLTELLEVPGTGTEVTEVPGTVARAYRTHRSSGLVQKMLYPYPGYCGTQRTETHRRSGYGYECHK